MQQVLSIVFVFDLERRRDVLPLPGAREINAPVRSLTIVLVLRQHEMDRHVFDLLAQRRAYRDLAAIRVGLDVNEESILGLVPSIRLAGFGRVVNLDLVDLNNREACPIAIAGAIERADWNGACSDEMQRPVSNSPSIFLGTNDR